jgi:hypothetical protein
VLSKIFGTKRDEMIGGSRKLHNEELHNLHSSPIVRVNEDGINRPQERKGEEIKPEGKRLLRRPRCRWKGNIKVGVT